MRDAPRGRGCLTKHHILLQGGRECHKLCHVMVQHKFYSSNSGTPG